MAPESWPGSLQSTKAPPSSAVPATPAPASLRKPLRVSVLFKAASSSPGLSLIIQEGQNRPSGACGPDQRSRSDPFSTTFPLEPGSPSSGSWVISISGYDTALTGADMLTVALPSGCAVKVPQLMRPPFALAYHIS